MADKENNNIVHFEAEKILYDLEKKIKAIGKFYGEQYIKDSLEVVNTSKAILRGELFGDSVEKLAKDINRRIEK